MAHFQQDGHMAITNPVGRVNYEPNSWTGDDRGPREDPDRGFTTFPAEEGGQKRRLRPESFADHYSQASLFYRSQQPVEQQHIIDAFTFELSKVETPDIRERMVANLRNVDEDLAAGIAAGLGLGKPPAKAKAAVAPDLTLEPSPALSILANGPDSFAGRKLGVLVSEGAPAVTIKALRAAVKTEGATLEVIAPTITGVVLDDGSTLPADQMVGGGPSVLYDAVALVLGDKGTPELAGLPAAKDFVADAHAHHKLIAHTPGAAALLDAAGVADLLDDGYHAVDTAPTAKAFLEACRALRWWERAEAG
jgi:catalase